MRRKFRLDEETDWEVEASVEVAILRCGGNLSGLQVYWAVAR